MYKNEYGLVVKQNELPTELSNTEDYLVRVTMGAMPTFYSKIIALNVKGGKLYLTVQYPSDASSTIDVLYGTVSENIATEIGRVERSEGENSKSLSSVDGYNESNSIAYENINMLDPFLDATSVVKYGNSLPLGHELTVTKIKSILPLNEKGDLVTYLTTENQNGVTSISLILEDNTIHNYTVSNNRVKGMTSNFTIGDINVPYTYDNYLISETDSSVTALTDHIVNNNYEGYLSRLYGNIVDNRSLRDFFKTFQKDA